MFCIFRLYGQAANLTSLSLETLMENPYDAELLYLIYWIYIYVLRLANENWF